MSNINLLPWRLARAQRQKKQFGIMIGLFLAATASLAFAVDWLVQQQIGYQQQRNQRLQQEMATLDTQLGEIRLLKERRKELIDRMQLIEQLQTRRNIPVRLCWCPMGSISIPWPCRPTESMSTARPKPMGGLPA